MIIVTAEMRCNPGSEQAFEDAVRAVLEKTRPEPGCTSYVAMRDIEDPSTYYFFEEWEDKGALRAHFGQPHLAEFQAAAKDCVAEQVVRMHTVESSRTL